MPERMGRSTATACAPLNWSRIGYAWTHLLVLLIGCSRQADGGSPLVPMARNGVLDARNVNLAAQDIKLDGTWKWYWNELRQPGQPETDVAYTAFPQLWSRSTWHHQPVPSRGYATYALTILLPAHPGPLLLELPDQYSSYQLFINGKFVARNGIPGRTEATTIPYWSTQLSTLPDSSRVLHLLLQVANFHHSKGGPGKSLKIGNAVRLQQEHMMTQAAAVFLGGCLFISGLFFLLLFGRSDRSILYFSLFCLLYSYRFMGADQYALHTLFPGLSWFLTIRLEYLSLFLSVATFALYTRSLYPDDTNPLFTKTVAGLCATLAGCTLLFPPVVFTRLVDPFLGLVFACIIYAFYVYIAAIRNHRPGAWYALMSTALLLIAIGLVILEYFGMAVPDKVVLFLGYLGFFFLQSLILSFRFASALQHAKDQAESGLKAKSEFLSIMSHEIRTPLNAVIGMTYLLQEDKPRPDQKSHLDTLLFSAKNLLNIVNDILDFSKIEAGKITIEAIPVDLRAIAQGIIATYRPTAAAKQIELRLVLVIDPAGRLNVLGDPTRLAQVLGNLVQNAIKFTQQGWVELRIEVTARTEAELTVAIAVEDTGIGIAPEKQGLIFNPFTQADASMSRSYGGTGLGLAICKTILERQGVALLLRSEPGRGSAFFFTQTFPIAAEPAPSVIEPAPEPMPRKKPLSGISVLLVEDYPMNVLFAKGLLHRLGASVDVATNGQEALDQLDATRHNLVLMDLQMPVMDGYESTRQMRERGETLPIIALTAGITNGMETEVWAKGLDDVLLKPFTPDGLIGMIQKHIKPAEV